ncbi:MAG TPA: hypothetical protein VGM84_25330 [Steroidobacteraceae bacterium]|jgi:hypothetical protein
MNRKNLEELLLQSLEHERGGVKIYQTALQCALHRDLQEEWSRYLEQTQQHVRVLTDVCIALELDPGVRTPGCQIVRENGLALLRSMEMALASADPAAAQRVACEVVVLAETKDHADWELIGKAAKSLEGAAAEALSRAYEQVEDEEDEHLYHTRGWWRELWLDALGIPAQLPPAEETQQVSSAVAAARVNRDRLGNR